MLPEEIPSAFDDWRENRIKLVALERLYAQAMLQYERGECPRPMSLEDEIAILRRRDELLCNGEFGKTIQQR